MANEPEWVSVEDLIEFNRLSVQVTGEPFHILDHNLLESACAKPKTHWHYGEEDDVVALAVQLMLGVARNHPFEQGNKRTAFLAGDAFIAINGYELMLPDDDSVADAFVDAITGAMSETAFTDLIREYVQPQ